MTLHPADQLAFDKAMVTQPVWNRFKTCGRLRKSGRMTLMATAR